MQINPLGNGPNIRFPANKAGETGNKQDSAVSGNGGAGSPDQPSISGLVGRLSIGRLVELLNSDTDIRAEKVDQAREKLETGKYLLPDSARTVADTILGLIPDNQNSSSRRDG